MKHEEHLTETAHASETVEAEVMQPEPLPEPEQEGTAREEDVLKVSTWRRRVGYFAAALAVGLVVWTGKRSLDALWYMHPEPGDPCWLQIPSAREASGANLVKRHAGSRDGGHRVRGLRGPHPSVARGRGIGCW